MSWTLKGLFGRGLQAAAKEDNVDPEALADAATQFSRLTRGSVRANDAEPEEEERATDRRSEDRRRSDDRRADDRRSDDRRADDRRSDDRRSDDRRADDRRGDDRRSDDRRADDFRSRMHRQLDRMMDAHDSRGSDRRSDDDANELRDLLDEGGEGEEQNDATAEAEMEEIPELGEDAEGEEEEGDEYEDEGDEERAGDELGEVLGEAEIVQPRVNDSRARDRRAGDVEGFTDESGFHPIRGTEGYKGSKAGDPKKKRRRGRDAAQPNAERARARDAQAHGAREVLRALRPLIARSKDSALRKGFTAQVRRVTGSSFGSDGNYTAFARAGRDHSRARDSQDDAGTGLKELNDFYRNAHNKKMEVK